MANGVAEGCTASSDEGTRARERRGRHRGVEVLHEGVEHSVYAVVLRGPGSSPTATRRCRSRRSTGDTDEDGGREQARVMTVALSSASGIMT
jgi:hypothetical protein